MNNRFARLSFSIVALVAACAGTRAQAQYAINQEVALAGIPNSGSPMLNDAPGYPITLTKTGAYKLTGNLSVPYGVTGIEIAASGVTLDLNGYRVFSTATCTRNETTYFVGCPADLASVASIGVHFKSGGNTLRNGEISGFTTGVQYKGGDQLENLLVGNNMQGVMSPATYAGARTLIRGVRAEFNAWSGFFAYDAMIQGSTAAANGGHGFHLGRSMVQESFAFQNMLQGFEGLSTSGGPGLVVGRNVSAQNKAADFATATSMGGNISTNGASF